MKDRYSLLAPFYNRLTKLVFGDQLKQSKNYFKENPSKKKVLIIGGGDGLDYRNFQNQLAGEYWEVSRAMLRLAKLNLSKSQLTFHLGYFQAEKEIDFDEVWLHFVLDTMLDEEILSLLVEIKKSLKPEGRIYLADFFAPKNAFQRVLNRSMINFFRIVVAHKRSSIPDYEVILQSQNWVKISQKEFLKGWVKAQIWRL
ncbi:class I SAM-dependent methyltransferase [uncultured Algoriphagus sp.]|mgnify:FL=1|uniref:class I SAM-dependent methyltransferase n=1 Tax=uncultured Algoriphagus sp. TaxID=417365 RepID=UPI0030ED2BC4